MEVLREAQGIVERGTGLPVLDGGWRSRGRGTTHVWRRSEWLRGRIKPWEYDISVFENKEKGLIGREGEREKGREGEREGREVESRHHHD